MTIIFIVSFFFFFNDTATTEIYTLSLHDALPISGSRARCLCGHLQPSRRYAEDDAQAGRLPVHQHRTILHGRADFEDHAAKDQRRHLYRLWINVPEWPRMPASQSTLVAADMARWDALAAQHRAATPAWAS